MSIWIPLNNSAKHGLMDSMSAAIAGVERAKIDFLPDLRRASDLVLSSDYSGEHAAATHHVLSFLLADRPGILGWEPERRAIRRRFLGDGRRIAFKGLADRQKQKAIGPFLASASSINGILFCVAVEKSISSLYWNGLPTAVDIARLSGLAWAPAVFEKLFRILHFGSFLVSGLCRPGQNLHWITDEDAIVANEVFQADVCRIVSQVFRHYYPHEMKDLALGIAGKFDDVRRAEDLISIVDLAGGALSESVGSLVALDLPRSPKLVVPIMKRMSTKVRLILIWLCESNRPLKKMIWVISKSAAGDRRWSLLNLQNLTDLPGKHSPLWVPPDKGWRESSEAW
jgi:hypothetical protein